MPRPVCGKIVFARDDTRSNTRLDVDDRRLTLVCEALPAERGPTGPAHDKEIAVMSRRKNGDRTTSTAGARELSDGPPDAAGLTPRQRRILEVIRETVQQRGYPPAMREIEIGRAHV